MRVFLISWLILMVASAHSQGIIDGFLDAPKSKVLALSGSYETADIYYLWNRNLEFGVTYFTASVYFKHQLNKRLSYAVNIPLVNGTPQDGTVFFKVGNHFNISKNIKLTGIAAIGGSHPLTNYNTETSAAIGQQTRSIGFRTIAQITFKNSLFISGRYGYNLVAEPTPDNSVASIKLGFYKSKWYLDVWFDKIQANGGKDYRGIGENKAESFRELGFNSAKIGGVIYHQTKEKLGLFLGGAQTISGKNAFKTWRISTGIVLKF